MNLINFAIGGIMGTVVQAYSQITNPEYFLQISQDFSDGRYVQGILKVTFPYFIPFLVSSISGTIVKKDYEQKIGILEEKIKELENE